MGPLTWLAFVPQMGSNLYAHMGWNLYLGWGRSHGVESVPQMEMLTWGGSCTLDGAGHVVELVPRMGAVTLWNLHLGWWLSHGGNLPPMGSLTWVESVPRMWTLRKVKRVRSMGTHTKVELVPQVGALTWAEHVPPMERWCNIGWCHA
jgi:hypothetical protein